MIVSCYMIRHIAVSFNARILEADWLKEGGQEDYWSTVMTVIWIVMISIESGSVGKWEQCKE